MIKTSPICLCIFTIAVISLVFSTGCFSFLTKIKRINALEEKVDLLSGDVESLNAASSELKEKINELALAKEQLNEEHSQLTSRQAAIESLQRTDKAEHNQFNEELSETKNFIREIEQKLDLIESDKNKIETQLEELANLYSKSVKVEQARTGSKDVTEKTKAVGKVTEKKGKIKEAATSPKKADEKDEEKTRETAVKETQEKLKSNLVEELLDKAIALYRQGKFEDAIAKWEEALALDPGKLEALFNIEIAQDRIKERQKDLGK